MRTTLVIADEILRLLRRRAREDERTLSEVVEEALRQFLPPRAGKEPSFKLKCRTFRGKLLPEVDLADRDSLYERMEGRS